MYSKFFKPESQSELSINLGMLGVNTFFAAKPSVLDCSLQENKIGNFHVGIMAEAV
jgi:hypothetical protein